MFAIFLFAFILSPIQSNMHLENRFANSSISIVDTNNNTNTNTSTDTNTDTDTNTNNKTIAPKPDLVPEKQQMVGKQKCVKCKSTERALIPAASLPAYVVRAADTPLAANLCQDCLRNDLDGFAPRNGKTCCAVGNYGCSGKPSRPIPDALKRDQLESSDLRIPAYAPQRSVCNKHFQVLTKMVDQVSLTVHIKQPSTPSCSANTAQPLASSSPSHAECSCVVCDIVRKKWDETDFVRPLCTGASSVLSLCKCLGFDHNSAEYRRAARIAKPKSRKQRKDAFDVRSYDGKSWAQHISDFWVSQGMPCPTLRMLVRKVDGRRVEMRRAFVLVTFSDLLDQFRTEMKDTPLANIGKSIFKKYRPFWIVSCPDNPRCRCRAHTEMLYLVKALRTWRGRFHKDCPKCGELSLCSQLKDLNYEDVRSIAQCIRATVEDEESDESDEEEEEKDEEDDYDDGSDNDDDDSDASSDCYSDDGRDPHATLRSKKRAIAFTALVRSGGKLVVRREVASVPNFVTLFLAQLEMYKHHHTLSVNQAEASKKLLSSLCPGEAAVFVDYSAKYVHRSFECIQADIFAQTKTAILVFFLVTKNVTTGELEKTSHFYISKNTVQDTIWTITALKHFSEKVIPDTRLFFFFDNASHFANEGVLNWLAVQKLQHQINFWAAGHGKGPWDAEGWNLKLAANKENKKCKTGRMAIGSAQQLFKWAQKNFSVPVRGGEVTKRSFYLLRKRDFIKDLSNFSSFSILSLKKHATFQKSTTDNGLIARYLSCFCHPCKEGEWDSCQSDSPNEIVSCSKLRLSQVHFRNKKGTSSEGSSSSDKSESSDSSSIPQGKGRDQPQSRTTGSKAKRAGSASQSKCQRKAKKPAKKRGNPPSRDSSVSSSASSIGNKNPIWEGVTRENSQVFHNVSWTCNFCGMKRSGSRTTVERHLRNCSPSTTEKKKALERLIKRFG